MTNVGIRESSIVEIESGRVRGQTYDFISSHSAASFLGIPFAAPPVGNLRFEKPQPVESWDNRVRDCTQFGGCCPHVDPPGSEHLPQPAHSEANSLTLNVFAPVDNQNKFKTKLPVLCYIHGGGFVIGNSSQSGNISICRYLCLKDLVVVTINYRLGLFGFMTTGDSNAKGNYGLFDQTAGLLWIQKNIQQFGGDPDNVTVCGHSAGGASSDLLNLSPHSQHLFHKVAPLAGSGCCGWGTTTHEFIHKNALELAKKRGFQPTSDEKTEESNRELIAFLRQLPADYLVVGFVGMPLPQGKSAIGMHVAPVYDQDFFPRPFDVLRREAPNKPMFTGITKFEALIFSIGEGENLEASIRRFLSLHVPSEHLDQKMKEIYELFNTNADPTYHLNLKEKLHLLSDLFIGFGVWRMAKQYVQQDNPNVYLFTFDYIRKGNTGAMGKLMSFEAASHGTEMPYLFGTTPIVDFCPTPEDEKLIDRFTSYLSNFAKSGNPNGSIESPAWLPLSSSHLLRHNVIRLNEDTLQDDYCDGRPLKMHKILMSEQSKI